MYQVVDQDSFSIDTPCPVFYNSAAKERIPVGIGGHPTPRKQILPTDVR